MGKRLVLGTARGFAPTTTRVLSRGIVALAAAIAALAFAPHPGLAKSTPAPNSPSVGQVEVDCNLSSTGSGSDNNLVYTETCNSAIDNSSALPIIANMYNGQNTISGGAYVLSATITGSGPTGYPYGTILGYSGNGTQGSDDYPGDPVNNNNGDDPFTQGSNVQVMDYASVTNNGAVGYPIGQNLNTGGVVYAASFGADGFDDTDGSTDHKVSNDNFSGTQGGPVTFDLESGASVTAYGDDTNISNADQYLPPTLSGIGAFSFGGNGINGKENDTDYGGYGGNAGAVTVNDAGTITMTNDINGLTPTYGIYAVSGGGEGANYTNYAVGAGGNGGSINIYVAGPISDDAPNGIGIVAESLGGNSDFDDKNGGDDASGAGDGGTVYTEIQNGGSVSVSGGVSIGVLAVSAAGNADNGWQGSGGAVTVQVDQGGSINTSGSGNSLSVGVLAISSGSIGDIEPSASSNVNTAFPGTPGDVTVTNYGSITTSGSMAIGVAALSVGGASIVTNATSGGTSNLGDSDVSYGGFSGQTATVTNNGSITTTGGSAYGIVALSVGGGGGLLNLENADQAVAYVGSSTTATDGGNGANVSITNSGNVTTGDGSAGGKAAIGIVAQSIGGGGGDSGAPAFFVGGHDSSGDGGGNGGTVTYNGAFGSEITTYDTNALGILAQSIGGGGGNGANAGGIFVAVGGQGGNGGNGGAVNVNPDDQSTGNITTLGDFSAGIVAQSIGGGGGNGGGSTTVGVAVSAAIGGSGGNGGTGGTVNLFNQGTITTAGNQAHGIVAQSIGGGGGTGGAANSYSAGVITLSIAVGGTGGGGNNGGAVTVTNNYHIYTGCIDLAAGCGYANSGASVTNGADSAGIVAQSIGGGGGNGGDASATSLSVPAPDVPVTISADFAVGGDGGSASAGNTVTVNNAGQIATAGDGSYGILAQSVGGGGGNGGDSTATAYALEGPATSIKFAFALGGKGGGGGAGGNVTVTNGADSNCPGCNGQIYTFGEDAAGILAQSIGGGGGTGSTGTAADNSPNLGGTTGKSIDVTTGVGGNGGSGSSGGTVTVTNDQGSSIVTVGSGAQGILAQSIGGGGGTAGGGSGAASNDFFQGNLSVGGTGGSGNNGGTVNVTNAGYISTGGLYTNAAGFGIVTGGDGIGILAQSIGGGGGAGGSSDAAATINIAGQVENALNPPSAEYGVNLSIGGKGNSGGNGGTINVSNTGSLYTKGIRAYGVEAQSIGGGGGNGGAATSTSNSTLGGLGQNEKGEEQNGTYDADLSVGGWGGASGNGGTVTVDNSGILQTFGYGAHAIFAQSIGGGGGVGGEGTVDNTTTVGLGIQSGGGAGNGGNGGVITVTNTGSILTAGDDAYGILAQSIGGGGGEGGVGCTNSASAGLQGVSASACLGSGNGATLNTAPWNDSSDFTFDLGGNSGAYGNGNTISLGTAAAPLTGVITTFGARAIGIAAQSIGGGGGLAGASSVNIVAVTPETGDAGNGGGIGFYSNTNITTYGAGAWGMMLQSIGAGGGFAGDASQSFNTLQANDVTTSSSSGDTVDGGDVEGTIGGNITTYGTNAIGVFAQSVGGGGGVYEDNGGLTVGNDGNAASYYGTGGEISITQASGTTIDTKGDGSIGIFAQSTGNAPQWQQGIGLYIWGNVIGGSGPGSAGIELSGGLSGGGDWSGLGNYVIIENTATLTTQDGVNGIALETDDGVTTLYNNGTIEGSLIFGASYDPSLNTGNSNIDSATLSAQSAANNDGIFDSGSTVTVPSFTNSGTMNILGPAAIGTTTDNGNFTQNGSGVLGVQIDSLADQTADLLSVTGAANIAGAIAPAGYQSLLPGTYTIATANGLSLSASVQQPLLFTWTLDQAGNSGTISPAQNFATPLGATNSLTSDQLSLAKYLASAWNNSDSALASTFATLSQIPVGGESTLKALAQAFSASATQGELLALKNSEGGILGASMSCPLFSGATTLVTEGSCVWVRVGGQAINQYATGDNPGFSTTGAIYRIGGEQEFAPGWFISGAMGEDSTWSSEGISSSSGQTYDGSLSLKRQTGNLLFAGSFAVANGSYRNNRVVELPNVFAVLKSDSSAFMVGSRLRAAYEIPFANWYLRPYGDLDILNINTPSFRENGNSTYALAVRSNDSTNVVISPMVEIGGRTDFGTQGYLRAFADLGISVLPGNNRTVRASFADANPADGYFSSTVDSPSVLGNADLGLQLYRIDGLELRADYSTQIGSDFFAQGGTLKLAYHF